MSSMECDLQNEMHHNRPGEFIFTWSIHNYSYCTKRENKPFFSPDFLVEFSGDVKWWLKLYPTRCDAPGFVSCYLLGRNGVATCNFALSIRKSSGKFKEENENVIIANPHGGIETGFLKFVSFKELQGADGYLINDTLTLRCRMWKTGNDIPASVNLEAHSRIRVSKLNYTCIFNGISGSNEAFENHFNKTIDIKEFFIDGTQINLKVFKKGCLCEGAIHFGIEMIEPTKYYFWMCVVHLIDSNGKIAHSARGEHLFECSEETLVWSFPLISSKKFISNNMLYLPNNCLTLQCELSFATDNLLETFVYGATNKLELESKTFKRDQQSDIQGVWIKNMNQCYIDGKFSDFIIRTNDRQFPVNRTILSAHSEVFDAMFERDMKERKTGMVDIEDLGDDTILKMLKFIYTGTLDDIDCSAAQELYFAADKYRITTLLKKCSIYLMSCLDALNVCHILEFADTHQDHELKSRARDFINVHAQEIVVSDAWRKLLETNTRLTSEILQWMFRKKFVNEE